MWLGLGNAGLQLPQLTSDQFSHSEALKLYKSTIRHWLEHIDWSTLTGAHWLEHIDWSSLIGVGGPVRSQPSAPAAEDNYKARYEQ